MKKIVLMLMALAAVFIGSPAIATAVTDPSGSSTSALPPGCCNYLRMHTCRTLDDAEIYRKVICADIYQRIGDGGVFYFGRAQYICYLGATQIDTCDGVQGDQYVFAVDKWSAPQHDACGVYGGADCAKLDRNYFTNQHQSPQVTPDRQCWQLSFLFRDVHMRNRNRIATLSEWQASTIVCPKPN